MNLIRPEESNHIAKRAVTTVHFRHWCGSNFVANQYTVAPPTTPTDPIDKRLPGSYLLFVAVGIISLVILGWLFLTLRSKNRHN